MAQIVTRLDDELVAQVDRLVADGIVASRSDAVRSGLRALIDMQRRRAIATAIVDGYRRQPQDDRKAGWSDDMTIAMIAEEPW